MCENPEQKTRIHISELDEFLAGKVIENEDGAMKFEIEKYGNQGYLNLIEIQTNQQMDDEGMDFDLSASEYVGLTELEISDYIQKPLYTSSAYELFDFLFSYLDKVECLIEFTGNAWKVKIYNSSSL